MRNLFTRFGKPFDAKLKVIGDEVKFGFGVSGAPMGLRSLIFQNSKIQACSLL